LIRRGYWTGLSLKKNEIEKQAIAALTHLADMIIFIIDSSETCGYSLDDQKQLLSQIEKMFSNSTIVLVENKVDFKRTDSPNLKISCETGEGIDRILDKIFFHFKSENKDDD